MNSGFSRIYRGSTPGSDMPSALGLVKIRKGMCIKIKSCGISVSARGRLWVSLSAQKSAQKSTQKSKPTQESAFLSKPTFLRAQKSAQKSWSAQKSAQKSAQTRGPLKKVLKRGGYSKECSKEGVAQKSGSLKRGLKKVLKKVSLLKRVSRTKDANFFWSCKYLRQCKFVCLYHLFSVVNLSFINRSEVFPSFHMHFFNEIQIPHIKTNTKRSLIPIRVWQNLFIFYVHMKERTEKNVSYLRPLLNTVPYCTGNLLPPFFYNKWTVSLNRNDDDNEDCQNDDGPTMKMQ